MRTGKYLTTRGKGGEDINQVKLLRKRKNKNKKNKEHTFKNSVFGALLTSGVKYQESAAVDLLT